MDWLVKHVANNNGKVGIYGVSYDGYTAASTLLHPHPALKAVSEQASPADQWMNDDDHRYGALRLSYDFEYSILEEQEKTANTNFAFDTWDTYEWYLRGGSLADLEAKYAKGRIPHLRDSIEHPDYDAFWRSQAWADALTGSTAPNLNVAGFWDQEDPWGPWHIFRQAAKSDPDHTNLIVAGPWVHGAWRAPTWTSVGPLQLGHDTATEFRRDIEAPYFAYWLHGRGERPTWTATTFQTGSNAWRRYTAWPPKASKPVDLYLHADGRLTFQALTSAEAGSYRQFVSDPANPVPYRARPVSPTYPGQDWRRWEMADQRFVDHRPDVLTFVSDPLPNDLVVTGEVSARIMASTSGTDGDLVLKLIDVAPEDSVKPDWVAEAGPVEGQYAKLANGYQLPIAMEVRRGRYLESFEQPHALKANEPIEWKVPLRARDHVFLKGHKIMVQVQATWFPLIDRNPQTFVESIPRAKSRDYKAATYRVFSSPKLASRITLPVAGQEQADARSKPVPGT